MTFVIPLYKSNYKLLYYDDNDDNNKAHEECTGDDEVQFHDTSTSDGAEWSTSRPGRFTPGKKNPGTH